MTGSSIGMPSERGEPWNTSAPHRRPRESQAASILDVRVPRGRSSARFARRLVREYCRTHRIDTQTAADVELMTSELVTNAFSHGRGAPNITIKQLKTTDYQVRITSQGDPFEWDSIRERPDDGLGSWGLRIVDQLATRWGIEFGQGNITVWFEFQHSPCAPIRSCAPIRERGHAYPCHEPARQQADASQ